MFPLRRIFLNIPTAITYEALTAVVVKRASVKRFMNFLEQNPSAMFDVIRSIIYQYDVYLSRINNLQIPKAYPRIVARLLYLCERLGKKEGNQATFAFPLTHYLIASTINMTRETASREIQRLVKKKIVGNKNKMLFILDLEKLKQEDSLYNSKEKFL